MFRSARLWTTFPTVSLLSPFLTNPSRLIRLSSSLSAAATTFLFGLALLASAGNSWADDPQTPTPIALQCVDVKCTCTGNVTCPTAMCAGCRCFGTLCVI